MSKTPIHPVFFAVILWLVAWPAHSKILNILTDIAPTQAIVAQLTDGLQTPVQLLSSQTSAHDFVLRPSDIRAVYEADLIIWTGPDAIPGLAKLLSRPELVEKSIALQDVLGTYCLPIRKPGLFVKGKGTEPVPCSEPGLDPHIWLYPPNALLWANWITKALSAQDSDNATQYAQNAKTFTAATDKAQNDVKNLLAEGNLQAYFQHHDAFQYFESYFHLKAFGAATVDDESGASLGVISSLRTALPENGCVFIQPEQKEKVTGWFGDGSGVGVGILDATGTFIGDDYTYPDLIQRLGSVFGECLLP